MTTYVGGQLVQVYSQSSGAWVDATVLETLSNASVKVRYGMFQKIIPPEFQQTVLRHKPTTGASRVQYAAGQAVEVYSKTNNSWVGASVRDVLPDDSIHVQYANELLYKVVPPELQASMVRVAEGGPVTATIPAPIVAASLHSADVPAAPVTASATSPPSAPCAPTDTSAPSSSAPALVAPCATVQPPVAAVTPTARSFCHPSRPLSGHGHDRSRSPTTPAPLVAPVAAAGDAAPTTSILATPVKLAHSKSLEQAQVASLTEESQKLRDTIEEQQKEISMLADLEQQEPPLDGQMAGCWTCLVCTFENVEPLCECEMCGESRGAVALSFGLMGSNGQQASSSSSCQPASSSAGPVTPAPPKRVTDAWNCSQCTLGNPGVLLSCAACEAPRDGKRNQCNLTRPGQYGNRFGPMLQRDTRTGHASPCARRDAASIVPHSPLGNTHVQSSSAMPAQRTCLGRDLSRPTRVQQPLDFLRSAAPQSLLASASVCAAPYAPDHADLVEVSISDGASASDTKVPPLRLPRTLHDSLRPYQREGVAWMWKHFLNKNGGILADDMGLGKTVQACGLIQAMRLTGALHTLIMMPVTLLDQWAKEIRRWCPGCPVYIYHGSAAHRAHALRAAMRQQGAVLLTSYAIISKSDDQRLFQVSVSEAPSQATWLGGKSLGSIARNKSEKAWDVVICDEAHAMRNVSTLLGKSLRKLRANCRILLTGTPVQNKLQDLWALMDFAQPGLLGNHATFVKQFNNPIENGSFVGASASGVALKKHLCEQLWKLVNPHLLRRTKDGVGLLAAEGQQVVPTVTRAIDGIETIGIAALPPKTEMVVWLQPTREQILAYQKALECSDIIHEANSKTKLGVEVFKAIALLKRLCNHPALGLSISTPGVWEDFLSVPAKGLMDVSELGRANASRGKRSGKGRPSQAAASAGAMVALAAGEQREEPEDAQVDSVIANSADAGRAVEKLLKNLKRDVDSVIAQSAKLRCLSALLPELVSRGHRTLIFSQGLKMMDLVEICVLRQQGIKYLRIDGGTDIASRNDKVNKFQTERDRYTCMLLTTRVGGYGLNLASADRVVLLDPAWNPATDLQAIDRAYRIGQDREVKTYRLVMSGLIEDKMFRLQVFKMGLTKTVLESKQQHRYFTSEEIRGLFEWTDPACGETRKLLLEKHGEEDMAAACADGAQGTWLKAGPAVGLSNFSTLYRSLAQQAEEDLDDCTPEVRKMKTELRAVETSAQQAAEAFESMEAKLQAAQKGVVDVAQQITSATRARMDADERIKKLQSDLLQVKRQEIAAERSVEKAAQACLATQKQQAAADEHHLSAAETAAVAKCEVVCAGESFTGAAEPLLKAVANVESQLNLIDTATSGSGESSSFVGAPASSLNAARKMLDRACKAFEAVQTASASAQEACMEVLPADAQLAACKAAIVIATKHVKAPATVPFKDVQAALKASEREHARLDRILEKAVESAGVAIERASKQLAELRGIAGALADSLHTSGENSLQRHVKAAQQELKASVRNLGAAWQAATAAYNGRAKANYLHRKAAQSAAISASNCKEFQNGIAAANIICEQAQKEADSCRAKRIAWETELEASSVAGAAAAEHETGSKRKRESCKGTLGEVKQSLKSARIAQKEAATKRESLYKHYAKADGSVRENLEVARSSAKASVAEQQKAVAAIQMLKDEEYDANQVVEAYDSKKKPRLEGDAANP